MKYMSIITILLFLIPGLDAQKVITGKSKPEYFKLNIKYKRSIPPNLFVSLEFEDDNGNGILEAEENASLGLEIMNKGKGPAQGLRIEVKDDKKDSELTFKDQKEISYLYPGKSVRINIPIKAGFNIKTDQHKIEINVKEYYGYDMDPAYLKLNTLEYLPAEIQFSGYEVMDSGEGTAALIQDGQIQPGERVKIKLTIQNTGQRIARNVGYQVSSTNANVFVDNGSGSFSVIEIGEIKNFDVLVSPNKRVINNDLGLLLNVNLEGDYGELADYKLPVFLNQTPPEPKIVEVIPDIEQFNAARFEYNSNKYITRFENIAPIRIIDSSKTIRPNSVGIVFGIENYIDLHPAPYAENDARIIRDYFKKRLGVEQVLIYTSEEARGFIFNNTFNPQYGLLNKLIQKGKTDLFVFYSGHGLPSKDGSQVYLFPSDGQVENLDKNGYPIGSFYNDLAKMGARSVTVFLDACFSGVSKESEKNRAENLIAHKGVKVNPEFKKPWIYNNNFSVFMSSKADETSLAFDQTKTGLFTYHLCEGMQGAADLNSDRKITNGELRNFLQEKVKDTSVKISGLQTPEFYGNEEFVLFEY